MTETMLLPTDVGGAFELLERAYAWEEGPPTPENAKSLEHLAIRAVQLASGLQRTWPACTRQGSVWETGYYVARIRAVEFLAVTVVDVLTRAEEILARRKDRDPEWVAPSVAAEVRPNLDAVRQIVANARELLQWLNREVPPANQEMIARSQESLKRGQGEAISDIMARLENGGPLTAWNTSSWCRPRSAEPFAASVWGEKR